MAYDTRNFYCGASNHLKCSADRRVDCCNCYRSMHSQDSNYLLIVGTGPICAYSPSVGGMVPPMLVNVAHVPGVSRHLVYVRLIADSGHEYSSDVNNIIISLMTEANIFAPSLGSLNYLNAFRSGPHEGDDACAVIASSLAPNLSAVDVNDFQGRYAYSDQSFLHKTAKHENTTLSSKLLQCKWCSERKGLRLSIKPYSRTRTQLIPLPVDEGDSVDDGRKGGLDFSSWRKGWRLHRPGAGIGPRVLHAPGRECLGLARTGTPVCRRGRGQSAGFQ